MFFFSMVGEQQSIEFGVIRNYLGICQGTNGTKPKINSDKPWTCKIIRQTVFNTLEEKAYNQAVVRSCSRDSNCLLSLAQKSFYALLALQACCLHNEDERGNLK